MLKDKFISASHRSRSDSLQLCSLQLGESGSTLQSLLVLESYTLHYRNVHHMIRGCQQVKLLRMIFSVFAAYIFDQTIG